MSTALGGVEADSILQSGRTGDGQTHRAGLRRAGRLALIRRRSVRPIASQGVSTKCDPCLNDCETLSSTFMALFAETSPT